MYHQDIHTFNCKTHKKKNLRCSFKAVVGKLWASS